jgi:hypothetical protein
MCALCTAAQGMKRQQKAVFVLMLESTQAANYLMDIERNQVAYRLALQRPDYVACRKMFVKLIQKITKRLQKFDSSNFISNLLSSGKNDLAKLDGDLPRKTLRVHHRAICGYSWRCGIFQANERVYEAAGRESTQGRCFEAAG